MNHRPRALARARALALDGACDVARDRALIRALAHALTLDRARDVARALDPILARTCAPLRDLNRARDLDRAIDRAHAHATDLAHASNLAHAHTRDLARACDIARDLALGSNLDRAHDLALALDRAQSCAIKLTRAFDRARYLHFAARQQAGAGSSSMPGRVPRGLVVLATRMLPVRDRPRYMEEFRDELVELPRHERLGYALRVLAHAWELRRVLTGVARTPDGSPARQAER